MEDLEHEEHKENERGQRHCAHRLWKDHGEVLDGEITIGHAKECVGSKQLS